MATETHADRSLVPGVERPAEVAQSRFPTGKLASRIGFVAILLFFTVLFVYPFIWLLSASLKPGADVFNGELIPDPVVWENYPELFNLTRMADSLIPADEMPRQKKQASKPVRSGSSAR